MVRWMQAMVDAVPADYVLTGFPELAAGEQVVGQIGDLEPEVQSLIRAMHWHTEKRLAEMMEDHNRAHRESRSRGHDADCEAHSKACSALMNRLEMLKFIIFEAIGDQFGLRDGSLGLRAAGIVLRPEQPEESAPMPRFGGIVMLGSGAGFPGLADALGQMLDADAFQAPNPQRRRDQ